MAMKTAAPQQKANELAQKGSEQLEALRTKRDSLSSVVYDALDQTEKLYKNINEKNVQEAGQQLSKLDGTLQSYGGFKQTIADLTEGLTASLEGYVEFASKSKNFQGFGEKFYNIIGMKKQAERLRVLRIRKQNPKENLQQVLNNAQQLVEEICKVREMALKGYERLQANTDVIIQKIAEYEPREAALKQQLEAMQKTYDEKRKVMETAPSDVQAKMVTEVNELHKKLTEVKHEYGQVLTIYNQAQQALKANELSRDSFEKMEDDLARQAKMIQEKIDNVTQIYLAVPDAVKILMTTKGMEVVDKTMNISTDKSVGMITEAAEAVSDATLAREEIQMVDEETMRSYMLRVAKTLEDYAMRSEKIRKSAQRSQSERYGSTGDTAGAGNR